MKNAAKCFNSRRVYLILDREVCGYEELFQIAKQAVRSGVDIVQLRDKKGSCRDILRFAARLSPHLNGEIPFIINDRLDVALAVRADGVHLGQEDMPLVTARRIAGRKLMIGISCQTLRQAKAAEKDGADYIGFGSVFKTLTKPERALMDLKLLSRVIKEISIPIFAIGGIDLSNLSSLIELGVKRVAVTRAILEAADVQRVSRAFQARIGAVDI